MKTINSPTTALAYDYTLENTKRWQIEPSDFYAPPRRKKQLANNRTLNQRQKRKNNRRAIAAGFTK